MKHRLVVVCSYDPSHTRFNGEVTLWAEFGRFPHPEDGDARALPGSPYKFHSSNGDVGECADEDCFGAAYLFSITREVGGRYVLLGQLAPWTHRPISLSGHEVIMRVDSGRNPYFTLKSTSPKLMSELEEVLKMSNSCSPYLWLDIKEGCYILGDKYNPHL